MNTNNLQSSIGGAGNSLHLDRRSFVKGTALAGAFWASSPLLPAANFLPSSNLPAAAAQAADDVPLAPPDQQPPNLEIPSPQKKIGWAVVGLGELALGEVMPAFRECRNAKPVALVSGHPDKARKVAESYGIDPKAIYNYETYDRLAENPAVDAIYIALPNSMHAEYSIRGLRAGKHVLCEKPMATSLSECENMLAAARESGKKLGIAYRLHYEPLNRTVMDFCRKQAYGEIKSFSSSNCQNVKAPNIRLSAALGGGPVGDVGVYSINAARHVTGEEPSEVMAAAFSSDDPRFREVPETVSYLLRFPSGIIANCDCSFSTAETRRYRVHCSRGFIDMDPAFSYRGLRLRANEIGAEKENAKLSEIILPPVNQFAAEFDAISLGILNNTPFRTPGEEGLADMKVVAAIGESIRSGGPVKV